MVTNRRYEAWNLTSTQQGERHQEKECPRLFSLFGLLRGGLDLL